MRETPWTRIEKRLEEAGLSPRRASLMATDQKNPDILRTMKAGRSALPEPPTLLRLAEVLQVSVDWIVGRDKRSPPPFDHGRVESPQFSNIGHDRSDGSAMALPLDLPVLGTVAASVVGSFAISGDVVEYVHRPPGLRTARNAYAVYVRGTSMEPRHRAGDLLFITPDRPAVIGDDVVIQQRAHAQASVECFLKTLVRETGDSVFARQLNPPGEIEYRRATIVAVHRVLTTRELFGA